MANLNDPEIRALLEPANYAVIATHNPDGSIVGAIVGQPRG
jgi:Pyridoxamine 5'-phosphate oxidase